MHTLATAYSPLVSAITIDPDLQTFLRKVAFILILAWIGYIIGQFAIPSKRSARIKWGRVIVMGLGSIILMDLSVVVNIINGFTRVIWWGGHLIFPTWFA